MKKKLMRLSHKSHASKKAMEIREKKATATGIDYTKEISNVAVYRSFFGRKNVDQ